MAPFALKVAQGLLSGASGLLFEEMLIIIVRLHFTVGTLVASSSLHASENSHALVNRADWYHLDMKKPLQCLNVISQACAVYCLHSHKMKWID